MFNAVNFSTRGQLTCSNYLRKKDKTLNFDDIEYHFSKQNDLITKENANVYDIYLKECSQVKRNIQSLDKNPRKETYYSSTELKTWALTDTKYTDNDTGISWYVRDGSPYMLKEDAEKFRKLCEENGEFALKKFAEMTGLIQKLDEDIMVFVGDNGTVVKSKDGKELFIDTSQMTYNSIMDMLSNLVETDDYFNFKYWNIILKMC